MISFIFWIIFWKTGYFSVPKTVVEITGHFKKGALPFCDGMSGKPIITIHELKKRYLINPRKRMVQAYFHLNTRMYKMLMVYLLMTHCAMLYCPTTDSLVIVKNPYSTVVFCPVSERGEDSI